MIRDITCNVGDVVIYKSMVNSDCGVGIVTHEAKIRSLIPAHIGVIACMDDNSEYYVEEIVENTRFYLENPNTSMINKPFLANATYDNAESEPQMVEMYRLSSIPDFHVSAPKEVAEAYDELAQTFVDKVNDLLKKNASRVCRPAMANVWLDDGSFESADTAVIAYSDPAKDTKYADETFIPSMKGAARHVWICDRAKALEIASQQVLNGGRGGIYE